MINDVKSFTEEYPDSTLDEYLQLVTLYGDKDSGKVEVTCEACGRKQEISVNIQDTVRKNMILPCDN